jgi:uncharacterized protein (TIGR03067 family)
MLALVFTVALAGAAPVPREDENEKALKLLQGKWKLVAGEERGEAGTAKEFDRRKMVFSVKGNTLTLSEKDKEAGRATIKLDVSKSPAHLDFVALEEGAEGTCHTIYKLEGDRLTICFPNHVFWRTEAKDRPTKFETGPKDQQPAKGRLLFVFERVKE